jgi:hypothetical protein
MLTTTMRKAAVAACLWLMYACSPAQNASESPGSSDAHSSSIAARYESQLVRRPGETPDDGKVYLIRGGRKHWIVDAKWLSANGYRWPDDVKTIDAAELAQIPASDPIQ